jgi:hypothetical protein
VSIFYYSWALSNLYLQTPTYTMSHFEQESSSVDVHQLLQSQQQLQQQQQQQQQAQNLSPPLKVNRTNLSSQSPQKNKYARPSRFIWGIATTDGHFEVRRRRTIRNTYLSLYKNDTDNPYRICSLNDLREGKLPDPDKCQLAYAFFMGANPNGTTELVDNYYNISYPLTVDPLTIPNAEPDTVYLNIRENQMEGKMQTWFHFGAKMAFQHDFDYVVKADSDTLLYPPRWFQFSDLHFPPAPGNERIYAGLPVNPQSWLGEWGMDHDYCPQRQREGKKCNVYIAGQMELLSRDLAAYISSNSLSRHELKVPGHEDMSIGEFVWSHPDGVNMITWNETEDALWEHTKKTKLTTFFQTHWIQYLNQLFWETNRDKPRFLLMQLDEPDSTKIVESKVKLFCNRRKSKRKELCFQSFEGKVEPSFSKMFVGMVQAKGAKLWPSDLDLDQNVTAVVWTLRHPADRFELIFRLEIARFKHMLSKGQQPKVWIPELFQTCFPTVDDLERQLDGTAKNPSVPTRIFSNCTEAAWAVTRGRNLTGKRFYSSYRELSTASTKPHFIIRKEWLTKDLENLERSVSGNTLDVKEWPDFVVPEMQTQQIEKIRKSQDARNLAQSLCCALHEDIDMFLDLVGKAVNLVKAEKEKTQIYLANRCGFDSVDSLRSGLCGRPHLMRWSDWYDETTIVFQ